MEEQLAQAAAIGQKCRCPSSELLPIIYADLQKTAAHFLARERDSHMLERTDLIDEAWLRVCRSPTSVWDNERHLFAAICRTMRRILVEQARRRRHLPQITDSDQMSPDQLAVVSPLPDEQLLALDEALLALSKADAKAAELVDLRFFGGLTQARAAQKMGISRSSADRLWSFSRAWLIHRIRDSAGS